VNKEKKIVIIAGPNGSGKTTFAREFLPKEADCPEFINADLIAAGISPFNPEAAAIRAGRLMLREINECVKRHDNFAFETTLSGKNYISRIKQWQKLGYHVKLIFLSLPNVEIALARIASRVAQGGHNVPDDTVRRRFDAGQKNFEFIYKSLVNAWILYDNSGTVPVMLDWGEKI